MAADISVNELTGLAEALYANQPAWHGMGKVWMPGTKLAPTSSEILAETSLGFKVGLQDIEVAGKVVEGWKATVREDTGRVLGIVGERYRPIQNVECFEFLDSLMMDGILRYESAFALGHGEKVCMLARLPSVDNITEEDKCFRYMFCSTSHDGSSAQEFTPAVIRVVCANTKKLALAEGKRNQTCVSVRHTENKEEKLKFARQFLSQFDQKFTLFRDQAQVLATRKFSLEQKKEFLATLFPAPEKDATDRVKNNHRDKMVKVETALRLPRNNLRSIQGTWWSLFNAVTDFVDHQGRYKGDNKSENRFLNIVYGKGSDLKDDAFTLARQLAA